MEQQNINPQFDQNYFKVISKIYVEMIIRILKSNYGLLLVVMLMSFALFSCKHSPPQGIGEILELAGDNKKELQQVLDHYQSANDSLKLKAAYFLIKNMPNKYSLVGEKLDKYNGLFPKIQEVVENKKVLVRDPTLGDRFPEIDSLWNEISGAVGPIDIRELKVEPDLNHITADFLIENIDYAFKAWDLPWSRHLSFDEFCEYVLPYRFKDEKLTSWRPQVYEQYEPIIERLEGLEDPVIVCDSLNRQLTSTWNYSHTLNQYPVCIPVENLLMAKMGTCTHEASLGVFVMRALGVPVVHEQVPHYGNRSLGHDVNAVLGKDGKFYDFKIGKMGIGDAINGALKINFLIPKIYRRPYSNSKGSLAFSKSIDEEVPQYFQRADVLDVTNQYLPVSDLEVALSVPPPASSNFVYLCVFDNRNWQAVSWAKIDNGKAKFQNMGQGFLYMPMYFINQRFVPAANPIILDAEGNSISISPFEREIRMVLKRKYTNTDKFNSLLVNGRFQGANQKGFNDAVDLYEVKEALRAPIYQDIPLENWKKFRYVRYLFPSKSSGNIAELSFFSENNEILSGNTISSKGIFKDSLLVKKAFDGDVLSSVFIEDKGQTHWVGLDLGERKRISKISFCPRTDKNNVWKGLNYELFYWDNGWKSLGAKKAKTFILEYDSPISNALYLLRCLDEGVEERIFTYEGDEQVWW